MVTGVTGRYRKGVRPGGRLIGALLAAGVALGVFASSAGAKGQPIAHHIEATYSYKRCDIKFVHGNFVGAYAGARYGDRGRRCSGRYTWVQAVGLAGPYQFRYGPKCYLALSKDNEPGCSRNFVSRSGVGDYWTYSSVLQLPIVISRMKICVARRDCDGPFEIRAI